MIAYNYAAEQVHIKTYSMDSLYGAAVVYHYLNRTHFTNAYVLLTIIFAKWYAE